MACGEEQHKKDYGPTKVAIEKNNSPTKVAIWDVYIFHAVVLSPLLFFGIEAGKNTIIFKNCCLSLFCLIWGVAFFKFFLWEKIK